MQIAAANYQKFCFLYSSVTIHQKFANEVSGPMFLESKEYDKSTLKVIRGHTKLTG